MRVVLLLPLPSLGGGAAFLLPLWVSLLFSSSFGVVLLFPFLRFLGGAALGGAAVPSLLSSLVLVGGADFPLKVTLPFPLCFKRCGFLSLLLLGGASVPASGRGC